jgi:hypothetical protein
MVIPFVPLLNGAMTDNAETAFGFHHRAAALGWIGPMPVRRPDLTNSNLPGGIGTESADDGTKAAKIRKTLCFFA